MLDIRFPKNKYCVIVKTLKDFKTDKRKRVFYYSHYKTDAMLDAYWAFEFAGAEKVTIMRCKGHKIMKEYHNLSEWKVSWDNMFGENARYMVWSDRH